MKDELDDWIPALPPIDDDAENDEDGKGLGVGIDEIDEGDADGDGSDDRAADDLKVGDDEIDETEPDSAFGDDSKGLSKDDDASEEIDFVDDEDVQEPTEGSDPLSLNGTDADLDDPGGADSQADDRDGTDEPVESFLTGELPPIDADEDGDFDDVTLHEESLVALSASELPPWADSAWRASAIPQILATRAITALSEQNGAVLVASPGQIETCADDDPAVLREMPARGLGREPIGALAAWGNSWLAVATDAGEPFISSDGGATFARVPTRRAPSGTSGMVDRMVGLAFSPSNTGRPLLFGATRLGVLLCTRDGNTWERVATRGRVVALTRSSGSVIALVIGNSGAELVKFDDAPAAVSATGAAIREKAWDPKGRLVPLAPSGAIGIAVIEPKEGGDASVLIALSHETERRVHLVRVDPDGRAEVVAEAAYEGGARDADDLGGGVALLWRPQKRSLWLGTSFGLFAFEPPNGRRAGSG